MIAGFRLQMPAAAAPAGLLVSSAPANSSSSVLRADLVAARYKRDNYCSPQHLEVIGQATLYVAVLGANSAASSQPPTMSKLAIWILGTLWVDNLPIA